MFRPKHLHRDQTTAREREEKEKQPTLRLVTVSDSHGLSE